MYPTSTRPEFVMMVGLIGAGKTHWVRNHIEKTPEKNWVVVSSNDVLDTFIKATGATYNEAFARFMSEAQLEMKKNLVNALMDGRNIIWDQTNTIRHARVRKLHDYDRQLSRFNYHRVAVVVHPNEELRAAREKLGGKDIPADVILNMATTFSMPTMDEGFDTIHFVGD